MSRYLLACCAALSVAFSAGCAAEPDLDPGESPEVDVDELQERYSVTDNGWTITALQPSWSGNSLRGGVQLTRTSGPTTRKAGVCLLSVYVDTSLITKTCNVQSDCNNYPSSIPSGGYRYCAPFNAGGTKYCMYRPGTAVSYCAGSPANGGTPVAPGTYYTQYKVWDSAWTQPVPGGPAGLHFAEWTSYGCLEACNWTDPSVTDPYGHAGF